MKAHILLVEDEPGLVLTLTDRLKNEHYDVTSAMDGEEGWKRSLQPGIDLIILDLMLPKMDGLEVCQKLRGAGVETPILMLTAKGQLVDKVVGLKLGADDYLPKPFEFPELLARVEALLRRSRKYHSLTRKQDEKTRIHIADLTIDVQQGIVKKQNQILPLSTKEFQLLTYFVRNAGKIISREQLLNEVWGYDAMPTTRTIDTHIAWLRQKIEANPKLPTLIVTVHGMGYKWVVEDNS